VSTAAPTTAPGRPARGRPPRISQDQIVEAALQLGLDAVSMQGIAEHLGVTTPALYSHVAGREQVLELVSAALRARLESFSSPATEWRAWLTDFAHLVRRHLAPSASTLLGDPGTSVAPDRLAAGEPGLRLLIAAGLTPVEAAYAVWLVFRVAITTGPRREAALAGFVGGTGRMLDAGTDAADDERGGELRATRAVHDALVAESPHDTLDFDLAVVLDGIAGRLAVAAARGQAGHPSPTRSTR
jgi:AcrR family transcriptional regulator